MNLKEIPFVKAKEKWVIGQIFDLPPESPMILIQEGVASLCKYHYPTEEEPYMTLSHPLNADSLDKELNTVIRRSTPKALFTKDAKHYYCPKEWSDKAIWTNA